MYKHENDGRPISPAYGNRPITTASSTVDGSRSDDVIWSVLSAILVSLTHGIAIATMASVALVLWLFITEPILAPGLRNIQIDVRLVALIFLADIGFLMVRKWRQRAVLVKRIWCFLFHWRQQRRRMSRNAYSWHCGRCNTRWMVYR